jgi:hypothetical protein
MTLPLSALDPDGNLVSVLVTPDGVLVTDMAPLPPVVQPYGLSGSVRVNDNQEVFV